MKNRINSLWCWILLGSLILGPSVLGIPSSSLRAESDPASFDVLMLVDAELAQSGRWSQIEEGWQKRLVGAPVQLHQEILETSQLANKKLQKIIRNNLILKHGERTFDLVVVVGDTLFSQSWPLWKALFQESQFLWVYEQFDDERPIMLSHEVSKIGLYLPVEENLDLIFELHPHLQYLAVVVENPVLVKRVERLFQKKSALMSARKLRYEIIARTQRNQLYQQMMDVPRNGEAAIYWAEAALFDRLEGHSWRQIFELPIPSYVHEPLWSKSEVLGGHVLDSRDFGLRVGDEILELLQGESSGHSILVRNHQLTLYTKPLTTFHIPARLIPKQAIRKNPTVAIATSERPQYSSAVYWVLVGIGLGSGVLFMMMGIWWFVRQKIFFMDHFPLFKKIFNSVNEVILICDHNWNIVFFNDHFCDLVKVKKDLIKRKYFYSFFDFSRYSLNQFEEHIADYERRGHVVFDWDLKNEQTHQIHSVKLSLKKIVYNRKEFRLVVVATNPELESRDELKIHDLTCLMREFNRPLITGLETINMLIQPGPVPTDSASDRAPSKILLASLEMMAALSKNMLHYSHFQDKALLPEREMAIHKMCDDLIHLFAPQLFDQEIELFSVVNERVPEQVKGHASEIEQILFFFFKMAVRMIHKGKIVLNVDVVDFSEESYQLVFEVQESLSSSEGRKQTQRYAKGCDDHVERRDGNSSFFRKMTETMAKKIGAEVYFAYVKNRGHVWGMRISCQAIKSVRPLPLFTRLHERKILVLLQSNHYFSFFRSCLMRADAWFEMKIVEEGTMVEVSDERFDALWIETAVYPRLILTRTNPQTHYLMMGSEAENLAFKNGMLIGVPAHAVSYLPKPWSYANLEGAIAVAASPTSADNVIYMNNLKGQTILILDSDRANCQIYEHYLRPLGAELIFVRRGGDALEVLRTRRIDLVISDWRCGDDDLIYLMSRWGGRRFLNEHHLLVVSAEQDLVMKRRFAELYGPIVVLERPFDVNKFLFFILEFVQKEQVLALDQLREEVPGERTPEGTLVTLNLKKNGEQHLLQRCSLLQIEQLLAEATELQTAFTAGQFNLVKRSIEKMQLLLKRLHFEHEIDLLVKMEILMEDRRFEEMKKRCDELVSRVRHLEKQKRLLLKKECV